MKYITFEDVADLICYLLTGIVLTWGSFDLGLPCIGWIWAIATISITCVYIIHFITGKWI